MSTTAVLGDQAASQNNYSTKRASISSNSVSDGDDEWWDEDDGDGSTLRRSTCIGGTVWPKPPQVQGLGVSFKPEHRATTRKADWRYSVQKPTRHKSKGRQRKQNAKAGIKLVTSFSRPQAAPPPVQPQVQSSRDPPQAGCFVDLAALQALNGGNQQQSGGFWKTKRNKELARTANTVPSLSARNTSAARDEDRLRHPVDVNRRPSRDIHHSPSKADDDLSPNDRPIVIGISIPTADAVDRTLDPLTAGSDAARMVRKHEHNSSMGQTPDTPTIIITPAQEVSIWTPLENPGSLPNHQPLSNMGMASEAPLVLSMPTSFPGVDGQRAAAQRSYFSPDSDDATSWGDDDDHPKSRIVSSCTVFEEDESPILVRAGRAPSMTNGLRFDRHASMSTLTTRRRSKGWWNYITTPFLTRSNTFTNRDVENESPPAIPSLSVAVAKVEDAERASRQWERQFSPLTPETTTSLASIAWRNVDLKHGMAIEQSPVLKETRHKARTPTSPLPLIPSETLTRSESPSMLDSTSRNNHFSIDMTAQHSCHTPDSGALQGNNPFAQSRQCNNQSALSATSQPSSSPDVAYPAESAQVQHVNSPFAGPPPPYSPSPARVRYRAVLPPVHALGAQYPVSPGPLSPGLQHAMSSAAAFPLSTVPQTPPARRLINLNSGYPELQPKQNISLAACGHHGAPPRKATEAEARRKRYEKEDAVAWRAGGWWRGRGCVPGRGCYGRSGAEGRKRRRWYLGLIIAFVSMIIVVVTLATTLHRKQNKIVEPSQWLNLTGFPPIFLGLSTVVAPANIRTNTGCVFPATQWSCDLPKELQSSNAPTLPNQPNFFLHIQWDNSSSTNRTFSNVTGSSDLAIRHSMSAVNPVSAGQLIKRLPLRSRQIVTFIPSPAPPSIAESSFLGNSTDSIVSANKAGEPTPFFISFLSTADSPLDKPKLAVRQSSEHSDEPFPNITSIIPPPSVKSDGTAAPANLLPFPTQQPIRLYDRGLPTEHYGFYTYFDRSIFLKSLERLNGTNLDDGEVPVDRDGGAKESEAAFRCTWSQTRFLVQIWTRTNTAQLLNSTQHLTSQNSATDFKQPGSFPYPITITTDRHGGDPSLKMIYCYEMDSRAKLIAGSGKLNGENRAFGGVSFNPAPSFFANFSDPSLGGFDGGTGGCSCQWSNFRSVIRA
ncbi:hypothetical protein ONS95_013895 [Cadophora gregata]|uniref:uncharacterized protein n=1 Tax=Cadophora gregata TaxID=51156 RepID=UPI0026DD4F8F|nr:uncharacterized protein ONS95_013895 [Cadophora gregata]KAK0114403.1 hypothetical protein ONS95_013895 [Cadophora gregata]